MPFTYEHSVVSSASPAAVWRVYSDVAQWPTFDAEAERIRLDGPFTAGTRGTMKFRGQEPLAFTLTEVEPERVFTDETPVGEAVVRVRHRLDPTPDGVRITQAVEIDGPEAFAAQLGAMITADMPATMTRLARLAEEDGAL
jgi:Polyketide cyclase / dehydrase and lipid transport